MDDLGDAAAAGPVHQGLPYAFDNIVDAVMCSGRRELSYFAHSNRTGSHGHTAGQLLH